MKKGDFNYTASDLSGDFIAGKAFDITDIQAEDHSYDLVICYHVLEHVEDDTQAMKELYRIVKPGGHCIIQTPFKEGDIYEDFSIRSPQERLQHFGQDDHVRIYSIEGLKGRLEAAGFKVDIRSFREEASNSHGYKNEDTILICNI
jgi:ubiquinone/menaquinone biosynthesis C-methylase UbiE